MARHSRNSTVVEYAVQEAMKQKRGPAAAAKATVKKLHGYSNMFIDTQSSTDIDASELEEAIWDRMVDTVLDRIPKMREGKEHFALDGTIDSFSRPTKQRSALRAELKSRIIARLGYDPFTGDV